MMGGLFCFRESDTVVEETLCPVWFLGEFEEDLVENRLLCVNAVIHVCQYWKSFANYNQHSLPSFIIQIKNQFSICLTTFKISNLSPSCWTATNSSLFKLFLLQPLMQLPPHALWCHVPHPPQTLYLARSSATSQLPLFGPYPIYHLTCLWKHKSMISSWLGTLVI